MSVMGSISRRELVSFATLTLRFLRAGEGFPALEGPVSPFLVAGIHGRQLHSSGAVLAENATLQTPNDRSAPRERGFSLEDCCFKEMELVGVGYRASVNEQDLVMNLGYSHPVVLKIPEGITVKVERNVRVTVAGYDRELIGRFCANIRDQRRPEPYKGKGIRYADEIITKKVGKKK